MVSKTNIKDWEENIYKSIRLIMKSKLVIERKAWKERF